MEEVPGIPGSLPPLATYRSATSLPPQEWQACLDSWLMSIEVRLRLQDDHFSELSLSQRVSGVPFLLSYFHHQPERRRQKPQSVESILHRHCYLLTKRLLLSIQVSDIFKPYDMVDFILVANVVFRDIAEWPRTLEHSIFVQSPQFDIGMAAWKTLLSNTALAGKHSQWVDDLRRMNLLVRVLPKAGFEMMKGADYIESLMSAFLNGDRPAQNVLTEHVYRSLLSLISPQRVSTSVLMDQIYLLKSESEQTQKSKPQQKTLCTGLVCETGFLRHLAGDAGLNDTQRGRGLIDALIAYREQMKHLHPLPPQRKRKPSKGKGRATDLDEMHIHKAAQISQVHDIFPELTTAYILRLLDHFHNNTEQVVAALLEPDSLPPVLQDQQADMEIADAISAPPDLAPHSTPPLRPQRKNVFDDDDFDNLRISSKQLHRGRKDLSISEANTAEEHNKSKAAIMAALAAFDSDDDERDDTYDVADVGDSVDQSIDTDRRPQGQDLYEEMLFQTWNDNPALFARDSKTRVSNVRQQLKRETGMTDEQIEGWAIMLGKDHAKQDRLTRRYSTTATFKGNQEGLGQTKWQQNTNTSTENSHDEGEDTGDEPKNATAHDGKRVGQAQIRGHRNWGSRGGRARGGGAGAADAGPSGIPVPSQASQNRDKYSKQHGGFRGGRGGRGGRHNQREGRARKMARGGFGGPPES